MTKQPKHFFKSVSGNQRISVAVVAREPEPEVLIDTKKAKSLSLPPKVTFTVGVFSLLFLFSLGFLPSILRSASPLPILLSKNGTGTVVLGQKGALGTPKGLQFDVKMDDGRIDIVAGFLARYNSPLKPPEKYARVLVETADKYDLDYRLLPAIMMQESNLCKSSDPAIHNCLGFGIHARGTLAFDNYEEGFDRAARELKERYIDIGLVTPEQIMTKYTPSSNGSWARSVNQWIAEMEYNSRQRGLDSEEDMNLTVYSR